MGERRSNPNGMAQTLARPGRMITGLFLVASSVAKPLELLKEMRPLATTFGYLFNATNPGNAEFRRIVEEAAARLGIKVDDCHFGLGKLYRRTRDHEQAQRHLTTAIVMYREMSMT